MTIRRKKMSKGLRIKPNTDVLEAEGEITVDSADNKLKVQLDSADRSVVTEDQAQTVTNKTIDATDATGTNTVSIDASDATYNDTNNTDYTFGTDVQSALDNVKAQLFNQNDADEISYNPAVNSQTTAMDVQGALDDTASTVTANQTGLSGHLTDTIDAHEATAIGYDGATSGLAATEVQAAIDELDSNLDTHITDTAAHGATGAVMGTTNSQTMQNKTIDASNDIEVRDNNFTITDNIDFSKKLQIDATNVGTGTTVTLTTPGVDTTLVGTATSQNLTNKTIDANNNTISNLAHGAEVDDPSSGVHGVTGSVVGTTDTQDLSGKTITDALTMEEQASTPTTPAAGDKKIYPKTDGKMYTLDDAGNETEIGSGSGSGGINYLEGDNSTAETSIGDWAAYDDGAVDTPVDGTGGSPTQVSLNNSPSNLLRGTKSFRLTDLGSSQGEGIAVPFTIDPADQAKKLTISFDYDTINNNYLDDEYKIYVYDVTNASLIRVNGEDLKAGKNTHYAQFQTSPDSLSYRLIFHKTTTSVLGLTISFDNVTVGPTNLAFGAIVTDWESFTPTWTNISGTTTGRYQRIGDTIHMQAEIVTSGAATGLIQIDLPSGLLIDTSKMAWGAGSVSQVDGQVKFYNISSNDGWIGWVYSNNDSNTFAFYGPDAKGAWGASVPTPLQSGDSLKVDIKVPIQGWSSNAQMSEDLGGREVKIQYSGNDGETITANTEDIPFRNLDAVDTTGSWTNAGNTGNNTPDAFTAPETGRYIISGMVRSTAATTKDIQAYVNGSLDKSLGYSASAVIHSFNGHVDLVKGDVLTFRNTVGMTLLNNSSFHYVSISKLASPQTMLETETVAAEYNVSAGIPLTSSRSTMVFDNKLNDTHGTYNTSTGVYTVPVSGYYMINASYASIVTSWTNTDFLEIAIQKNTSTELRDHFRRVTSTTTTSYQVQLSDMTYLEKGDTIEIKGRNSQSANTSPTQKYTRFTIAKIK